MAGLLDTSMEELADFVLVDSSVWVLTLWPIADAPPSSSVLSTNVYINMYQSEGLRPRIAQATENGLIPDRPAPHGSRFGRCCRPQCFYLVRVHDPATVRSVDVVNK